MPINNRVHAKSLEETNRRREKQHAFNAAHGITPKGINKSISDIMEGAYHGKRKAAVAESVPEYKHWSTQELIKHINTLEKQMYLHAKTWSLRQQRKYAMNIFY